MLYAVPYTLPLEKPAVPEGFLEEQLRALQRDSPAEISARICLCRHPRQGLREVLEPHSLVVIGGRKRWWPTEEQRLARLLKKDGHHVVFAEIEVRMPMLDLVYVLIAVLFFVGCWAFTQGL